MGKKTSELLPLLRVIDLRLIKDFISSGMANNWPTGRKSQTFGCPERKSGGIPQPLRWPGRRADPVSHSSGHNRP